MVYYLCIKKLLSTWCQLGNAEANGLLLPQIHIMAGLNSILKIFTPKNKIFFDFFEQMADKVVIMGEKLDIMVKEPDYEKRDNMLKEIENLEHTCDDITHTVFTELGRNFITPFDREDIHYLANALDDIADYIWSSGKKIHVYRINPNEAGIQSIAQNILDGSKAVKEAVYALREMKHVRKVTDALIRINTIENEADDEFDRCIEQLFETESDFKQLIKRRELYQTMEIATDKIEDAGNVIESIIIKYA